MTRLGRYDDTALDGYGIADVDRPQRRAAIDLDAISAFNEGTRRAIDEYAIHPLSGCTHRGRCKKEQN